MILDCSILFICIFCLFLVSLVCLPKRQLYALTFSIAVGLIFTVISYFLIKNNIFLYQRLCSFVNKIFVKIKINLDEKVLKSFVMCLFMISFFCVFVILCEIIFVKIANGMDQIAIKNKKYYVVKSILIVVDLLIFNLIIVFAITSLNFVYEMRSGFLSFIFRLAEKGFYFL